MNYKFFDRYIDKKKLYPEFEGYLFFEQNYWNDMGFETLFEVYKPEKNGMLKKLGSMHIAKESASLKEGKYKTFDEFDTEKDYQNLPEEFLSLGNDEFYMNLHKYFNREECYSILDELNDLCFRFDRLNFNNIFKNKVISTSFFRGYSEEKAEDRIKYALKPLAKTGHRVGYDITYTYKLNDSIISNINFKVNPDEIFPQNVHAIIGNNGSGKTTFIKDILSLAITQELQVRSQFRIKDGEMIIEFSSTDDLKVDKPKDYFLKVILISFSPFDNLYLNNGEALGENGNIKYLGLYQNGKNSLNFDDLSELFTSAIKRILEIHDNWKFFREILQDQDYQGDILPIIDEIERNAECNEVEENLKIVFNKISAGQKIILLSIATLITEVEQYSLVLIDEPELFLHPPMISNYIRSISKIMKKKNGVCILTTHSPIIVQEIPKGCVKIIQANADGGIEVVAPEYETFGENLSTLTNTIFGLNQYKSGFYLLIKEIVKNPEEYGLELEDIKQLKFGRDGMLYKQLLLMDLGEIENGEE